MNLWRTIANWWTPEDKVRRILDTHSANERECRVMEARLDALQARKRALEIEAEIRLRTRGRAACYADN